jgi:hypothetical protein
VLGVKTSMSKTSEQFGRAASVAKKAAKAKPQTELVKPGELVEARFARGMSPSAAARKTLALLIQAAAAEAWAAGPHSIAKKEIRRSHKSNERIEDVLDELQSMLLKIDTVAPDGRAAKLVAPVIAYRVEHLEEDDDSKVYWEFSEVARRAMQGSNYYAALNKGTILAFESRYSVTLYERGCLLVGRRNPRWSGTVEELREVLGVPAGKYRDWTDIRRFVLDRAVQEVNHLADFVVGYKIETGSRGKITKIDLAFRPKDEFGRDSAARELDRSRVGRKARRAGTVEDLLSPAQRRAIEDLQSGRLGGTEFSDEREN